MIATSIDGTSEGGGEGGGRSYAAVAGETWCSLARSYSVSGAISKPLSQAIVPISGSTRTCAKKAGSASGSETPRQCRPAKSMSPTSPSSKVRRSRWSPMTSAPMTSRSLSIAMSLAEGRDRMWLVPMHRDRDPVEVADFRHRRLSSSSGRCWTGSTRVAGAWDGSKIDHMHMYDTPEKGIQVTRSHHIRVSLLALGVLMALAALAPSALAVRGHVFAKSFGSEGSGPGQFSEPEAVAVSEATGDVYVADRGNGRVQFFEPELDAKQQVVKYKVAGQFTGSSAVGRGMVEGGSVTVSGVSTEAGEFTSGQEVSGTNIAAGTTILAVGAGATLELSHPAEGSGSEQVALSAHQAFVNMHGIAVDNACALHEQQTHKPMSGSECEKLDPSNGDIYVTSGMVIDKFDSTGAFIGQITGPPAPEVGAFQELEGVAVDPGGQLWVMNDGIRIGDVPGVDNFSNDLVNKFVKFQDFSISTFRGSNIQNGFAVDSADDLYVRDKFTYGPEEGVVAELNDKGEVLSPFNKEAGAPVVGPVLASGVGFNGVAVELSTGDVYIDNLSSVGRFGPFEGVPRKGLNPGVERFGEGHLPTPQSLRGGIAVSSVSGRVFVVAGSADEVQEYELEPQAAPTAENMAVSGVTSSSASLNAVVNPRSEPHSVPPEEPTSYRFEYTTEEQFEREGFAGAASIPGVLAPAYEPDAVSVHPQGLASHTVYHFRVVAENQISRGEGKPVVSEERVFTTQPVGVFGLLDGRGWELVSSPDKLGALLLPLGADLPAGDAVQAAAGGGGLTFAASAPTEVGAAGNLASTQVLSSRTGSGWVSRDLTFAHAQAIPFTEHPEYPLFSADLSLAAVQPLGGFEASLSPEGTEQTAYVRGSFLAGNREDLCVQGPAVSCFRPLVTASNAFETPFGVKEGGGITASELCPPDPFCGPQVEAASPDLSHIVLTSRVQLVEGSGRNPQGLFEAAGGSLKFVGVGRVGAGRAEGANNMLTVSAHALSTDGSRVIFNGISEGKKGLLLRDTVREETVRLAGSEAVFLTASADGSRVFFTSEKGGGPLEECVIGEDGEAHLRCNASGMPLDLSQGQGILAPIQGASEDASSLYFASESALTGEETNQHGEKARAGQPNLYLLREGTIVLVAVLSPADAPDWGGGRYSSGGKLKQPERALSGLTARVSPDGRWLAFMSERSLTGYDNHDALTGQPDQEVFLFHAPAAGGSGSHSPSLVCASCNPTGGRPHGLQAGVLRGGPDERSAFTAVWPDAQGLAASVPGWSNELYQSRYLSNGGRLFFNSSDALVAQDTNNTEDVYEYEPPAGPEAPAHDTCTPASSTFHPASGGCLDLISNGVSGGDSGFLDASETGGDVFFLTTAPLSKRDTDTAYDVYDAHIEGTEPAPEQIPEQHVEPVQPPEAQTPGSLTFFGPGNLIAPLPPPPGPKGPTAQELRAKHLATALRQCRRKHSHHKRQACERSARKAYGAKSAGRSSRGGGHR